MYSDLPEIEALLLEIETALPEIKTALLEIESTLPEIEILSYKVENNYQFNEGLIVEVLPFVYSGRNITMR